MDASIQYCNMQLAIAFTSCLLLSAFVESGSIQAYSKKDVV